MDAAADPLAPLGLRVPLIVAPMAGGPGCPELVAAVVEAGAGGFLAAGMRSPDEVRDDIRLLRARTDRPFGVNVFVPGDQGVDADALAAYARRLRPLAERLGTEPGRGRWDDDGYPAKLDVLVAERVPVVGFVFGCPATQVLDRLHDAGCLVVVTVTTAAQARQAYAAGVDALVVQGAEAGGHQGGFDDTADVPAQPLRDLLPRVRAAVPIPLIATGGLMTGADVAAVLTAGAAAAQLGTAFLCCPEAGTAAVHRRALLDSRFTATALTRAFTGRTARGLVNAFVRDHDEAAPAGYPWVHHLTRPLRTAAVRHGDADAVHLWAGAGWRGIRQLPAAELVALLGDELARAPAR